MLLAIDTCGALGGVALGGVSPGAPVRCFRELAGKTFSERLLATISELVSGVGDLLSQVSEARPGAPGVVDSPGIGGSLSHISEARCGATGMSLEAGASLGLLTGVVVVHGPGSFTGIRIGVSAAKGLAEALEIPVIAVSRLELLARQVAGDAIAVLDAGRSEFYVGVVRGGVREAESLLTREELIAAAAESGLPVVVCEERVLESLAEFEAVMVAAPTAVEALVLGAERFRVGTFDDVVTLDANYLRRADSEILARLAAHAAAALRG